MLFIAASLLTMKAQFVTWAILPGEYDKIEYCADNLFKVTKGGNVDYVNGSGKIIPELSGADRITGFYDGYALVLQNKNGQERIVGILSTKGQFTPMQVECYAIHGKEFCSEGFIPVKFGTGKVGYVRTDGTFAHDFDKGIKDVDPFSEGYAVVGKGQNSQLLDTDFMPIRFTIDGVTDRITSVYQGKAIIANSRGKCYELNVSTKRISGISQPRYAFDYMDCIQERTKRPKEVPYEEVHGEVKSSKQGGKYGYDDGAMVFIPFQFDEPITLCGWQAIVKYNGKSALLSIHKGTFDASPAERGQISYKKNKPKDLSHKFTLRRPNDFVGSIPKVSVKRDGTSIPTKLSDGQYEFYADAAKGKKYYTVEVSDQGLIIWEGALAYEYIAKGGETPPPPPDTTTIINKKDLTISLSVTQNADKNNKCYATATVYNPRNQDVTTTVTITGTNGFNDVSQTITIPAKSSKEVTSYFMVKKDVKNASVRATESATGQAAEKNYLELKKYKEPKKQKNLKLKLSVKQEADPNNRCHVSVTVSNPNDQAVTTTVTLSGTSGFNYVTQTVTIPAKGSKTVSSYFTVKKVVKNASVKATESATGQKAEKKNLQLTP